MSSKPSTVLTERPDELIDAKIRELGPDANVVVSLFRGVPGAHGGGTWPGIRAGIHCPLVRVKEIAQACSDLLVGGARIKVRVDVLDETGNKHRLIPEWFESFDGTPRMGQDYDAQTIAWDPDQEAGAGAFVVVPRQGRVAQQPVASAFGSPIPGPVATAMPPTQFPRPQRDQWGRVLPPPAEMVSPYLRTYPPEQQWAAWADAMARQTGTRPSIEPVDLALSWKDERGRDMDRVQVQAARLEEKNEHMRMTHQQQLEAERNARVAVERRIAEIESKYRQELADREARAREDKMLMKIEALESRLASGGQVRQGTSPVEVATALAPFAPVILKLIDAQSTRQNELMLALLGQKPAPQESAIKELAPLLAAIAPLVSPVLVQWMANNSPEKTLELNEQRQMQGQAMIQMMMDFIKWQTPQGSDQPWWLEPLMKAVDGVIGGVKMAALTGGAPPMLQPPPQQQPQRQRQIDLTQQPAEGQTEQPQPAGGEAAQPIQAPQQDLEQLIQNLAKVDAEAAHYTQLVMRTLQARNIDPRFITHEWTSILFAIHHRNPVDELAQSIVDHLEHCRSFGLMPEPFAQVFDKPEAISSFLQMMPISAIDTDYTNKLTEALVEEITSRERERKLELEEEEEEDDEEEGEDDDEDDDEQPAPSNGARAR